VADRYYGEDYQLFTQLEERGVVFVIRLRDEAVIQTEEPLPVSTADAAAAVKATAWVKLGCRRQYESSRLRVVLVQTPKEELRLVTNLDPEELSAGEVALLYKERWRIELFFRWIKCILGCRHWLAESVQGVALEIYLALIAALLLQLYTGQRPNRRMMEVLQFYAMGVATVDDVMAAMQRHQVRKKKK
jgi:IS4 transposase